MKEKEINKYYWLREETKDLSRRIKKLEKMEEQIVAMGDGVGGMKYSNEPKSPNHSKTSIQEKIISLKEIYLEKRVEALEVYLQIETYINTIEDAEIRTIIRCRNLDLMTWNQIADKFSTDKKIYSEDAIKKKYQRFFKN